MYVFFGIHTWYIIVRATHEFYSLYILCTSLFGPSKKFFAIYAWEISFWAMYDFFWQYMLGTSLLGPCMIFFPLYWLGTSCLGHV